MDHLDIKTEQAKELEKKIFAIRSYLRTMQGRIRELKFPVDDELKVRVNKAENAVSDLQALITCMACGSGMGRPPQRK